MRQPVKKLAHPCTIRTWSIYCTNSLKGLYLSGFLFTYKTVKSFNYAHTLHKHVVECEPSATSDLVLRKTGDQVDRQENTGADIAAALFPEPRCLHSHTAANQPESNLCVWWENLKWQHDCRGRGSCLHWNVFIRSLYPLLWRQATLNKSYLSIISVHLGF